MSAPRRPRVVAIVQARMGSTRLPGKVLAELAGEPMLARVLRRAGRATRLDEVLVAIPDQAADDALAARCAAEGWPCFRGAEADVLDRYLRAAEAAGADVVVRVTADCPFLDPAEVDRVVAAFLAARPVVDYAANVLPPRRYPRGLDTEVLAFPSLARAAREAVDPADREHVTRYLLRHPASFRLLGLWPERDLSGHRWTVDTPEDLAFAERVYAHFGDDHFTWQTLLALVEAHPDWEDVNRHVPQKEA